MVEFKKETSIDIQQFIFSFQVPSGIFENVLGIPVFLHPPPKLLNTLFENLNTNLTSNQKAFLADWLIGIPLPQRFSSIIEQAHKILSSDVICETYIQDSFNFIQLAFPSCSNEQISHIFEICEKDLLLTVLGLLDKFQIPQPSKHILTVTNSYASSLILVLKFFDNPQTTSYQTSNNEKISFVSSSLHISNQISSKLENEDLIECGCCFEQFPFESMVQCTEGHLFCIRCLTMFFEAGLSEGRINLNCLDTSGCSGHFSQEELNRVLPSSLLQRISQTEAMNAVLSSNVDHLYTCYKCGFKAIDDSKQDFFCPNCGTLTCKKCGLPKHNGPCGITQSLKINKEAYIAEKLNEAVIRVCPHCHIECIKESGCNSMRCPMCHTNFCYICQKEIFGYEHFSGPEKCPLYTNIKEEQEKIINLTKIKVASELDSIPIFSNKTDQLLEKSKPNKASRTNSNLHNPKKPSKKLNVHQINIY